MKKTLLIIAITAAIATDFASIRTASLSYLKAQASSVFDSARTSAQSHIDTALNSATYQLDHAKQSATNTAHAKLDHAKQVALNSANSGLDHAKQVAPALKHKAKIAAHGAIDSL